MKHIGFDDSLVMREFSRIAGEQGLVKVAQELPETKDLPPASPGESKGVEEIETGYRHPETGEKYAPPVDRGGSAASELSKGKAGPALTLAAKGAAGAKMTKNRAQAAQATLNELYTFLRTYKGRDPSALFQPVSEYLVALGVPPAMVKTELGKAKEYLAKLGGGGPSLEMPADDDGIKEAAKKLPCGCKPGGCAKNAKHDCDCPKSCPCRQKKEASVKIADEKLYDVSGETGEQLIDKAHPGGGTKTELTHSKTDENLVETIVEQQKRDIEVAQKIPKGTYAALKIMRNRLEKLGANSEQLWRVDAIISKVATPENIAEYELVTLADRLDALGSKEAADKVDAMIVRVAVDPSGAAQHARMLADKLPAHPWGAATKAPGAVMSRVGPAAVGLAGAAKGLGAAALPWLLPAAGVGAAGLAAYFIGKDLLAMESTLDGVIDRLEDLDPNEQAAPVVQQWIATLQGLKPRLKIPQASSDAETQKKIMQQRIKDVQHVAQQLQTLQQQYARDIKPNLTDWGFDAQQAEKVIGQTAARFMQQAQQMAAKLPAAEKAGEKQKAIEEKGGAGAARPDKAKPKGFRPAVLKFQKQYNRMKGKKALKEDGLWGPNTAEAYKEMKAGKAKTKPEGESPAAEKSGAEKAENMMLAAFKKRFARLPLARAPELADVLRRRARELYNSKTRLFTEEQAMKDLPGEFAEYVSKIRPEDVKRYIKVPELGG